jgi:hypothetical protein
MILTLGRKEFKQDLHMQGPLYQQIRKNNFLASIFHHTILEYVSVSIFWGTLLLIQQIFPLISNDPDINIC